MDSIFNKSFVNPTGKPLSRILSSMTIQDLSLEASLKRDPNTGAFPMKFPKLPRTPFLLFPTEHPWWLPLQPNCFQYRSSHLEVFYKIDSLEFS